MVEMIKEEKLQNTRSISETMPSGPGARPVRRDRRIMFSSPILNKEPQSVRGGGSTGTEPMSEGAFQTFSERYSANTSDRLCLGASLPETS